MTCAVEPELQETGFYFWGFGISKFIHTIPHPPANWNNEVRLNTIVADPDDF
jgi:hypothetical protein